MKNLLLLPLAILLIGYCASNAPVPTTVPVKSTNVTISMKVMIVVDK